MTEIDESDDWVLLAKVASGDRDALRKIFMKHETKVFAYIRKKLKPKESAEDACQEVFLRLLENASKFKKRPSKFKEGNADFSSLLFGIAENVLREFWRHEKMDKDIIAQVDIEILREQPKPEPIDFFYRVALEEIIEPRNWRKEQPLPSLAFHLAVFRRRQAGVEQTERSNIRQKSTALKGSAVFLRYQWLRLWASGKASIT